MVPIMIESAGPLTSSKLAGEMMAIQPRGIWASVEGGCLVSKDSERFSGIEGRVRYVTCALRIQKGFLFLFSNQFVR